MTTPPSGDEGLHLAPQDKPPPRLLQSAVTPLELRTPVGGAAHSGVSRAWRVTIVVAVILVLSAAIGGTYHWVQSRRYPVVVTIGVPDERTAAAIQPDKLPPLVPVMPDMLEVTSIAMGDPRLAIVNGKRLGEGDSLLVKTRLGAVSLRVVSIEDGLVRFRHGGETIDVKLRAAKKTPH